MYEYFENEDIINETENNKELRKMSSGIGGIQKFLVAIKPIFFSVIFAMVLCILSKEIHLILVLKVG